MTIGSPLASAVSGPAVADTNAICLPSGDHATSDPCIGIGAFVPSIAARNRAPVPSARTTDNPFLSPTLPLNASHAPSPDQCGSLERPSPMTTFFFVARSMMLICGTGRPVFSLRSIAYATRFPSGEMATLVTERRRYKSLLCSTAALVVAANNTLASKIFMLRIPLHVR